ncbi:Mediator complex, subunit Med20, partial [Dillenia turbinata]
MHYKKFASRLLHRQPNAGASVNSQILREVSQCAENMNGVKEGRWKSTLTFYRPMIARYALTSELRRDFLGFSMHDQPNKYYFIIRAQRLVLEADLLIQTIMEKLQSYKMRVALNFEGIQYRLGDFQVRVGKVALINSESEGNCFG